MQRIFASAFEDIGAGLRQWRVWVALASEDIGDQHRRTTLGPVWLLVNYLAFAGTFVVVFGHASKIPNFAAYVSTGLLVWIYISEVTTQSVSLFSREESFIKGTTLPLSVYVLRLTMQSVIRSAYALCGCLAILLFAETPVTADWFYSSLAILVLVAITPAAIIFFATVGAFFPDIQFVVSNVMRLGMFLTPIFWVPSGGGLRTAFYHLNPFTYFIEIVRIPIISGDIPVRSFGLCISIGLVLWLVALLLLGRFRKQIVLVL